MQKSKRVFSLLLMLALLFSVAACGSKAEASEADVGDPGIEPAADVDTATGDTDAESVALADFNSSDKSTALPDTQGEAFVLTAAEWNDNVNWPFFTNLVNAGTIAFPSFGIDPRHRVKVTVRGEDGTPLQDAAVQLLSDSSDVLWTARSDDDGIAYLFYSDESTPAAVSVGGKTVSLTADAPAPEEQGTAVMQPSAELEVTVSEKTTPPAALQVMFIVDTTGSMGDEIAYLQKDFSAIAEDIGNTNVTYSVNFYRDEGDEYVTKCNGFTSDIAQVQTLLNAEYADGGGDTPEAVAEILAETMRDQAGWAESSEKLAFLIFDAPPHSGTDAKISAAVRYAAEQGIRLVPVVASNAERDTELFGRALAICTNGTYVFLTDDSGVGESHLEPIVGDYTVELLHDVIVRIIQAHLP